MSEDIFIGRRQFLALLCGAAFVAAMPVRALASDDDDSGGNSGSGSSGSGSGSNSGSGSSGSGSGSDDSDDDDDGDDDSGSSGSGGSGSGSGSGKDQDRARDAVQSGKVIPLSKAITLLRKKYSGRIIQVRLTEKGSRIDYRFKVVESNGRVASVTMDAQTGRIRSFLGI